MSETKVFIACPIGAEGSPERIRSDKLLRFVIHPVVGKLLSADPEEITVRSDKIGEPGRITTQILRELIEARVVIADLTDTNPNVMYEVGVRQALMKPLVLMAEKNQKLPFDLNDLRTVFYQLDLEHFEAAQTELRAHVEKALAGKVSPLDEALFSINRDGPTGDMEASSRSLLVVLEACENILKESQETKELVLQVGRIALDLQESKDEKERLRKEQAAQEMGKIVMSQFLQNPDAAEKLLPLLEKFAEFGQSQQQTVHPPSRQSRRKGR